MVDPVQLWTEVQGAESLGFVGGSWAVEEQSDLEEDIGLFEKQGLQPSPVQLILALQSDDDGQIQLLQAFRSFSAYGFRLVFTDGQERKFNALVTAIGEIMDAANSVLKVQVALQMTSDVERV